jgi:hypothetical protein
MFTSMQLFLVLLVILMMTFVMSATNSTTRSLCYSGILIFYCAFEFFFNYCSKIRFDIVSTINTRL